MVHCGSHVTRGSSIAKVGQAIYVSTAGCQTPLPGLADRDPLARKRCAVMRRATSVKIANPMMPKSTYSTITITHVSARCDIGLNGFSVGDRQGERGLAIYSAPTFDTLSAEQVKVDWNAIGSMQPCGH
jgi:hypothetical protein